MPNSGTAEGEPKREDGARPLRHVTLPMIAPYMISAFALSLSLSMGELGATMMIYPPNWATLPVTIFSLTDRGSIANGATLTMILVAATLLRQRPRADLSAPTES